MRLTSSELWKARAVTLVPDTREAGLVGVGYQGLTADELVEVLVAMGVSRLVDVRLNPVSRKPGLSKAALGRALAEVGIDYQHRRELGNPKDNRAGFAGPPADLAVARSTFQQRLSCPEADKALQDLASAGRTHLVALLCYEADQQRCHRDVVLREAHKRAPTSWASTHQER
ncbi:DUF488 family protein [Micromonospora sp. NPDC005299]|uniref:DUF488 domain-containing protein n=1 Tax=Micromonospora sp. NPDC005299 TaxID=3364231 RepID=UPI0036C3285D